MKKQRRIPGSILEIQLRDYSFSYAQVLKTGVAFFEYNTKDRLVDLNILSEKPIAFIIEVYDHAITKGRWGVIGKLPIREDLLKPPLQFIQDELNPKKFELYEPISGNIFPAKREECVGLERAAVWEPEHVEERLMDHYHNKENIWVKKLSIK